jgi:hypothetical protein
MSWHFGNFFDLALESHVRFLQILDVLVLHLVHVDVLQNFGIISQDKIRVA